MNLFCLSLSPPSLSSLHRSHPCRQQNICWLALCTKNSNNFNKTPAAKMQKQFTTIFSKLIKKLAIHKFLFSIMENRANAKSGGIFA
jgi:hypothetical protein